MLSPRGFRDGRSFAGVPDTIRAEKKGKRSLRGKRKARREIREEIGFLFLFHLPDDQTASIRFPLRRDNRASFGEGKGKEYHEPVKKSFDPLKRKSGSSNWFQPIDDCLQDGKRRSVSTRGRTESSGGGR